MVSATFGDQLWSCRGVGLSRVTRAIKVRRGPVTMVFENARERKGVFERTGRAKGQRDEAKKKSEEKRDSLPRELEEDEGDMREKKGFFGLF